MLTRIGPALGALLMAGPILAGLAGTLLPAFGVLPALGHASPSLAPFRELAAEPGLSRSALLAVSSGLLSTAVALAAVFLFLAGWTGTRSFLCLRRLISPMLAVPHAAAAFGLAFLIAPSGLLSRLVSPELTGWDRPPDWLIVNDRAGLALAAGLAVKEVPFLFLMALAALPQINVDHAHRLATALGYGRVAGFMHTVWPSLYRQIRLPVFAVIAYATSVVDVAAILGPTTPPVLAVRLVAWMNDPDLAMRLKASAGALLQLGVSAAAIALWIGLERVGASATRALCGAGRRFRHDAIWRWGGLAAMTVFVALMFAGLAALALWSVAGLWLFPELLPQSLTLDGWRIAFGSLADPLLRTVLVGLGSAGLAVLLAVAILVREDDRDFVPAYRARLLFYLPLIMPQVAFLFGMQTALLAAGIEPSGVLLVAVHLVFVLPYALLSLSDPWRAFDRRHEAIAYGLGKNRARMLVAVKLPMLAPALMIALAVGFAVSVGLYLPTLLIGAGRLPTVTTEAVALASGGNRRLIGVWALVQAAIPALGFVVAGALPRLLYHHRRIGA